MNLAADGDANFPGFIDMVLGVCERTARSPERFAQTGTGWVLRELSKADPERVAAFVHDQGGRLSTEAVRMAVAKLPAAAANVLLAERGLKVTGRRR